MVQLALKLASLTLNGLKTLATNIATGLTGNANFTGLTNPPAAINTAVAAVVTQEGEVAAAESKLEMERVALGQARVALENVVTAAGAECVAKVTNDPQAKMKLLGANFPLRADNVPAPMPGIPTNVQGSYGDLAGEIDFQWNSESNRDLYVGEIAEAANGPYTQVYLGKKSNCTAKNLVSGKEYFFRVCCIKGEQRTDWSELSNHRAK